jgi:hypothetical protein
MPTDPNKTDSTPVLGYWEIAVLIIAGAMIVGLVAFLTEFYGRANEPSTAAILGIVIPVIGTLASGAFGVAVGTKSGKSGATQIVASKTNEVASVLPQVDVLLEKFATPHESRRELRTLPAESVEARSRRIATLRNSPFS